MPRFLVCWCSQYGVVLCQLLGSDQIRKVSLGDDERFASEATLFKCIEMYKLDLIPILLYIPICKILVLMLNLLPMKV